MKIAFLILAHKNPEQIDILFEQLNDPDFSFFIHLDKKVSLETFIRLKKKPRVHFIENSIEMKWAGYSLVQATINGMSEILKCSEKYDYINLISGQDFPIKSNDSIKSFMVKNRGKEFITCPVYNDQDAWWQEAAVRVEKYSFHNWKLPGKYRLQFLINRITPKRAYPINGHIIAGRSQWFCITTNAAEYILKFIQHNPRVVRFFKYVWGADEFIFSTILFNSEFRSRICDNLVYTDWSEGKPNPKTFTTIDIGTLLASEKLFARKFDITHDSEVLQLIRRAIAVKTG